LGVLQRVAERRAILATQSDHHRNVARFATGCVFETQDTFSFQSGIVAVGGTLYVTAFNTTYAIDGATCQQKWKLTRAEPPPDSG